MKPALDPEASTLTLDFTPAPAEVKFRIGVGLVVLMVVLVVIYLMREETFVVFIAGGFGLFALFNLIYGVIQSRFEKSLTITDTMVFVNSRTILGRDRWEEPVASYRGVLMREDQIIRESVGNTRSTANFHIIELAHPESANTLPLYVREGGSPPRDLHEAFARRFALPALMPDSGGETARAHDALDRSIAGTSAEATDPGPPPSGVKLRREGEATRINLHQSRKGKSFMMLYYLAVPVIFGGVAYQVEPVAGYVAAGMATGLILFMFTMSLLFNKRGEKDETALFIDRDRIWIKRPEPGGGLLSMTLARRLHAKRMQEEPQSLPRDTVEQIRVDKYMTAGIRSTGSNTATGHSGSVNYRLLIEADEARLSFPGGQFGGKKLEWVRDYLRFVLAGGVISP